MMERPRTLTGREPASSSPMLWVEKTATCPTFVFGQTTPQNWQNPMVCQRAMLQPLQNRCSRAHPVSTKTPCRGNSPMWSQAAWRTCLTFKGQTTPWMLPVLRPWPPCWMPVGCCRRGKWTSCSRGLQTAQWTQPPLRSSPPSGPSLRPIPLRLMHVPMVS